MARRRPRTTGAHFQQRRSANPASASAPAVTAGLSSSDARQLAERISDSQQRFRVSAIRLLPSGACGVIVIDGTTGHEHLVEAPDHWLRLQAG